MTHTRFKSRWATVAVVWKDRAGRHRRPALLLVIGLAAGVLAATTFYVAQPPSAGPATTAAWPTAALPAAGARAGTGNHIQPVALSIPAIAVSSGLVQLGLNADKTLQVPTDFQAAGWFALGPAPGDGGGPPAIIAGHVDSSSGPAVFYRLRELTKGADIAVTGIDGVVRHFTVYRTADYAKAAFPTSEVYAPAERPELRLITCAGTFDRRAGSYVSNLVVYAALAAGR